jgi:alkylation response protein AidB-like acyl-CoA dehydrogenase
VANGGLGLNPKLQKIVNERLLAAGAPNPYYRNPIGYGMCGPTVAVWGSDEQKQRYLRPLFTGEEIWCQLFSEPGAGSDFAGLASKGVRLRPLRCAVAASDKQTTSKNRLLKFTSFNPF